MQRLNLHICGAGKHNVTREQLSAVPVPHKTDTYTPVPHTTFIDLVSEQVRGLGFEIVADTHTLSREGARYFGLMQVQRQDVDGETVGTVISARNSYDKSLAAMIGAGSAPFVCTNLIFSCEHSLRKRHTVNVFENLFNGIGSVLDLIIQGWAEQEAREQEWRTIDVTPMQAHDIVVRAAQRNALPKTKILDVVQEFAAPRHDFGGSTVYGLQQAFTEVLKQTALDRLPARSAALVGVLDHFVNGATDVPHVEGWRD